MNLNIKKKKGKLTMKDMCEVVEKSRILKKKDGTLPTAKEIFNYSPTGELFMIWEWYEKAKMVLENPEMFEFEDE